MAFDPVSNRFVKEEWLDDEELQCKNESGEDEHANIVVTPKEESYVDVKNIVISTFEDKSEIPFHTDDDANNVIISTCVEKNEKYVNAGHFVSAVIIGALEGSVEQGVQTDCELEGLAAGLQMQCESTALPESKNKSNTKKRQQNPKKVKGKQTLGEPVNKKARARPKRPLKCVHCGTTTESKEDLDDHLNKNHYWCKFCQEYYVSKEIRTLHIFEYHKKCGREVIALRKNSQNMKKMQRKYCDLCGRAWACEQRLKKHLTREHRVVYRRIVTGNGILQNV